MAIAADFKFGSYAPNTGVHGPRSDKAFLSPHRIKQLVPGKHLAWAVSHIFEQPKLEDGGGHDSSVDRNPQREKIELQITQFEFGVRCVLWFQRSDRAMTDYSFDSPLKQISQPMLLR